MKRYRCKHAVEAMQWDGSSRELLIAWHEKKTGKTPWFVDGGSAMVNLGDEFHSLIPGSWLAWSDGEFMIIDEDVFCDDYEEELGFKLVAL